MNELPIYIFLITTTAAVRQPYKEVEFIQNMANIYIYLYILVCVTLLVKKPAILSKRVDTHTHRQIHTHTDTHTQTHRCVLDILDRTHQKTHSVTHI